VRRTLAHHQAAGSVEADRRAAAEVVHSAAEVVHSAAAVADLTAAVEAAVTTVNHKVPSAAPARI
jgi:hypothetical protein